MDTLDSYMEVCILPNLKPPSFIDCSFILTADYVSVPAKESSRDGSRDFITATFAIVEWICSYVCLARFGNTVSQCLPNT